MSQTNKTKFYDIVVMGGGMSGVCAAIAAARNGAKTIIIEQHGYCGGALSAMGVGPMMTFFAGEKQVIQGIGEELISRLVARNFSPGHVLDSTNYISYVTPFDAEGLKLVLDEMLVESGCEILYHSYLTEACIKAEKIESITITNKNGLTKIAGNVFIDATGDADLAKLAGIPCQLGRESDNAMQPMTMNMKIYNVDTDKLRAYSNQNLAKLPRLNRDSSVLNKSARLSFIGFEEEFKKAREAGELSIPREDVLFFETNNIGEYIINTTRIIDKNSVKAEDLTEAEIIGRQQCHELFAFLVKTVPGFEHSKLQSTGPNIGIRQSRQVKGQYTLTKEDIINNTKFKSTIAHSGYPIDIHNPKGVGTESVHAVTEKTDHFERSVFDTYYQIPLEIMLTNEIENLGVTGRCVSASFEAQAAIRTTPTMTALGQAMGTAAILAVLNNNNFNGINISDLQEKLIAQGSFIEK